MPLPVLPSTTSCKHEAREEARQHWGVGMHVIMFLDKATPTQVGMLNQSTFRRNLKASTGKDLHVTKCENVPNLANCVKDHLHAESFDYYFAVVDVLEGDKILIHMLKNNGIFDHEDIIAKVRTLVLRGQPLEVVIAKRDGCEACDRAAPVFGDLMKIGKRDTDLAVTLVSDRVAAEMGIPVRFVPSYWMQSPVSREWREVRGASSAVDIINTAKTMYAS